MRAKDRKARLYQESAAMIAAFKRLLLEEFVSTLELVVGVAPTLVLDSGWGYHAHYAVAPDVREKKEALRKICAAIIQTTNTRCLEIGRTMSPPIEVSALFDATHDVGSRLARRPETKNTKAKGKLRTVTIVSASETVIDQPRLLLLQGELIKEEATPEEDKPRAVPRPARPKQARKVEVDFRSMHLSDGRNWQTVIASLGRGERTKVVCPFGGTSIGSGFFAIESDGRARYYSSPTSTTYWNAYKAVRREGLADLIRGPSKAGQPGTILKTVTNLVSLLRHDSTFDLWYNGFTQSEMDGPDPLNDSAWVRLVGHMEAAYGWFWRPSKDTIWSCFELVCRERTRNPVADYLRAVRWDGCSRVDRWLIDAAKVEDTPLHRAYGRRWFIGLVARALKPGCKNDVMLILVSRQGFGKSSLFREIVDIDGLPDLFGDTPVSLKDKDSYLTLYSSWVLEDAELTASTHAAEESKKAFLSSSVDRLRPPFGRKVRTYRRHSVVVGTSNELTVLKDRSGSRRFWVLECPKRKQADLAWIRSNRDQLFAEAVAAYSAGEQWWLTPEEDALRALANRRYAYIDFFSECAEVALANNGGSQRNRFTVAQFAAAIGRNVCPQGRGVSLSSALRRAGFARYRTNGATYYYKDQDQIHGDTGLSAVSSLSNTSGSPYSGRLTS